MKPTYTKLAADGSDMPADSTDKHLAVRVDHPLLKAPIIVAAYRAGKFVWKNAAKKAEEQDAYGWQWRLPTVEELFLVADRTNPVDELDKNFFPDADGYEYAWSSTVDAESPSVCAWCVYLGDGGSSRGYRGLRSSVRAVRAGQF